MTTSEIERLWRDYSSDPALRSKLDAAKNVDDAAHLARAAGYEVTAGEITAAMTDPKGGERELTGRQLDAVAGGKMKYF